jgi:predicted nucleotidyltransferase
MIDPLLTVKIPSGFLVYVFGSFLHRQTTASDLDVLGVYNSKLISPRAAYKHFRPFTAKLQKHLGLRIDVTLLSIEESETNDFIRETGCVPLDQLPQFLAGSNSPKASD